MEGNYWDINVMQGNKMLNIRAKYNCYSLIIDLL